MEHTIKLNMLRHTKGQNYYAVIQNPTVNYYDTKVIWGSTPEIVGQKIDKQLKKWQAEEPKV